MPTYRVTVIKVLKQDYIVEACSETEAKDKAADIAYDEVWDELLNNARTDIESVAELHSSPRSR